MNTLLIILITVTGLSALLLTIGLFSKKDYIIDRQITILRSPQNVFNYIKYLKNQDNYNKWVMMDPAMQKEFKGNDGTDGFIYAWDGNNKAGAGEQEIRKITEGKRIEMEVRFKRPFKGIATTYMETGSMSGPDSEQEKTNVKWVFGARLKYPMNVMLLFMNMDKILGNDITISLANLKSILEK